MVNFMAALYPLAQGSIKGKDNISHYESLGAVLQARNNVEELPSLSLKTLHISTHLKLSF